MSKFVVRGYLVGVDGHRLTIRVDDEDVEHITLIKMRHKKTPHAGNFITINARAAKFEISNLAWAALGDLVGVHLHATCSAHTFHVRKKISAQGVQPSEMISMDLVSFRAHTIKNE